MENEAARPVTAAPRLLDQLRSVMRLHHYSIHPMIYTHILQQGGHGVVSPLDDL